MDLSEREVSLICLAGSSGCLPCVGLLLLGSSGFLSTGFAGFWSPESDGFFCTAVAGFFPVVSELRLIYVLVLLRPIASRSESLKKNRRLWFD